MRHDVRRHRNCPRRSLQARARRLTNFSIRRSPFFRILESAARKPCVSLRILGTIVVPGSPDISVKFLLH